MAAIARDTDGSMSIKAAYQEDGERKVKAVFEFATPQAQDTELELADHRRELDATTDADHKRVLMVFTRTNVGHAATGKRFGELVQSVTASFNGIVRQLRRSGAYCKISNSR